MSMPGSSVIGTLPMAQTRRAGPQHRLPGSRFITRVGLSISLVLAVAMMGPRLGAYRAAEELPECGDAQALTNLVFIIDRSGSLANNIDPPHEGNGGRGQTYNVEIEGVMRALLDPSVIPRDGSVSVGAVAFDGAASIILPLTQPIGSPADAKSAADRIKAMLLCPDLDSNIDPCPAGDTNFGAAISLADVIAGSGARRVFIMSTDGEPSDKQDDSVNGVLASQFARARPGEAELNVILIGVPTENNELEDNKRLVERIVFPPPPADLPGAVEVIDKTKCNESKKKHSAVDEATFEKECGCQVRQFADFTRRALRRNIASRDLTVTTAADSAPGTPAVAGSQLSLRQAIETANANGGRSTITFSSAMTIRPSQPLPPLTAPDITICGCAAGCATGSEKASCGETTQNEANPCDRKVTIDGQFQLDDGIVIRSRRDVVRGLTITRFRHAGIVIQPVCLSGKSGFNRIERNLLDGNTSSGVCVLDPPPGGVTNNVGNTISENDILGSETPIDLGSAATLATISRPSICDGPTPNDPGDPDEGPNHLINFPDELTAETTGNTVTITGKANGPGAPGSRIEIFAVQQFKPSSGVTVVTAVIFFKSVSADQNGAFSVSGVSASPILGYTATVTDIEGNTSELRTSCSGPALAAFEPGLIRFSRINPTGTAPADRQFHDFTILNRGCSELDTTISVRRAGASGRFADDDSIFFPLRSFDSLSLSKGSASYLEQDLVVSIAPGGSKTFQVGFAPLIPMVVTQEMAVRRPLRAIDVLPGKVKSDIILKSTNQVVARLIGRVGTKVKLIDPETTSNPAKVTLERSEDNLLVTFSVFDSDLDVDTVDYEFFKTRGGRCTSQRVLPVTNIDRNLTGAITDRKLITGQSFTVVQRFSGARDNPDAGCVRVTVTDAAGNVDSAPSLAAIGSQSSRKQFESQALSRSRGATIVRPTIKLPRPAGASDKGSGANGALVREQQSRFRERRIR